MTSTVIWIQVAQMYISNEPFSPILLIVKQLHVGEKAKENKPARYLTWPYIFASTSLIHVYHFRNR